MGHGLGKPSNVMTFYTISLFPIIQINLGIASRTSQTTHRRESADTKLSILQIQTTVCHN